ncbi:hypothetical protein [Wolbachia endosymbiont of Cylisticus convexus]|uniref:hypothetical protein n=1 Tax=Wolbachia endosymbiont of Cylisticus convexus TaxID=118728 RepID=UPI0011C02F3C|nr:hypothetical protein [Wolbachia endosymbiont of Cylisticus convexus]
MDLQQNRDGLTSKCMKKCADMVFESGNTLEAADKCRKECESPSPISSHLQKPMLNDLSDKLAYIASDIQEAQNLLSMALENDTNQDLMYF